MNSQLTQPTVGFKLFQERLFEFAEFIVTDLRQESVRLRWLKLPESVKQQYADEELQLINEKNQHVPIQNVAPAQLLFPGRITMRYPAVARAVPQQYLQRNVYENQSCQRENGGHQHQQLHFHQQQFQQQYQQQEEQLQPTYEQLIDRQKQFYQQRRPVVTSHNQSARGHPGFHITNTN